MCGCAICVGRDRSAKEEHHSPLVVVEMISRDDQLVVDVAQGGAGCVVVTGCD